MTVGKIYGISYNETSDNSPTSLILSAIVYLAIVIPIIVWMYVMMLG